MTQEQRPAFSLAALQSAVLSYLVFVAGIGVFGTAKYDLQTGLGMVLGAVVFYGPVCVVLLCFPLTAVLKIASRSMPLTRARILGMSAACGAALGGLYAATFGPGLRKYTSGIPDSFEELVPGGFAFGLVFGLLFAWRYRTTQK